MDNKLAVEVAGMLVLFPQSYDQGVWARIPLAVGRVTAKALATAPVCGSTLCVAGHIAARKAPRGTVFAATGGSNRIEGMSDQMFMYVPDPDGDYVWDKESRLMKHFGPGEMLKRLRSRYSAVDIFSFARQALGIDYYQAQWLFDSNRSEQEVFLGLRLLLKNPDADVAHLTGIRS